MRIFLENLPTFEQIFFSYPYLGQSLENVSTSGTGIDFIQWDAKNKLTFRHFDHKITLYLSVKNMYKQNTLSFFEAG